VHHASLGWLAASALGLFLLIQTLRLAHVRSAPARRLARIRERGRAGEHAATALIERAGYRIDALQPELDWTILCDGEAYAVPLRADLLVSRAGRRFIAEVKTGSAANLATPATRRQLLEYSIAYDVDGVLLVDVERDRIHEVRYPTAKTRERSGIALRLSAAMVVLVIAWLVLRTS
jgi:hypothetical protein